MTPTITTTRPLERVSMHQEQSEILREIARLLLDAAGVEVQP